MAPEYATRGCLTRKADVYSFGVVTLEIVSGESNTNSMSSEEYLHLLDLVCYYGFFVLFLSLHKCHNTIKPNIILGAVLYYFWVLVPPFSKFSQVTVYID